MEHALLNEIAICIVVAWIIGVAAQLLRQPLILAYLIAGFLIGPLGLGWVKNQDSIQTISGLGLILLLFMIGLEIDLKKMLTAGKLILSTAAVQIFGGVLLGLAFFWLIPLAGVRSGTFALYLAVACALSSTVIIVKLLYEKRELDTFSGRITLGVLVLQDLFAILFLAIQPQLKAPSIGLIVFALLKVMGLMAVAFLVSRYLLPQLFRAVARLPELVMVGALAWCFIIAGLAGKLGLSMEMGALVAGVAISTFPYTLDVASKVTTLRDFFVTLFFVSLGMRIPYPTWAIMLGAAAVALFLILSRCLTVFPVLFANKLGHRASVLPTLHLSQLSELSLVVIALGIHAGDLPSPILGMVAYAFAFLAVASSYGILKSEAVLQRVSKWLKGMRVPDLDTETIAGGTAAQPRAAKIFLLGFSWSASSLLEEITSKQPDILEELAIIDFNPAVHAELKRRGLRAIYGDISQRETLVHAGIAEAEIVVCSLPNMVMKGTNNLRLVQQLRELNQGAKVIVHAELFDDVNRLYAAGASYVYLPRLIESIHLCDVIEAARQDLLDQRAHEFQQELENRKEVIP
jgi:Kef-type K+ transport system membrane component KefB